MGNIVTGQLVRNRALKSIIEEKWLGCLNLPNKRALVLADVEVHSEIAATLFLTIYWTEDRERKEVRAELDFNQEKNLETDPDLFGEILIFDETYTAAAWIEQTVAGKKSIRLSLEPHSLDMRTLHRVAVRPGLKSLRSETRRLEL